MTPHIIQTVFSLEERDGGVPRAVLALGRSLARRGVAVDLLAGLRENHSDILEIGDTALKTSFIHPRKSGVIRTYPFGAEIDRVLAASPGSAVLLHDNGLWSPANISVGFTARRRGLKYILSPHGMLQPGALAYNPGRKKIAWRLYQHAIAARSAGFLATSELEFSAVRKLFPRKPVALIPNGVDSAMAGQAPAADPRNVLYMSKLHPGKNVLGLLAAWKLICRDCAFDDWTLTIAGDDSKNHRSEIETFIADNQLANRVKVVGIIDEDRKASTFADAALLVLPSFSENFGLIVPEALAHGVPAIATHGTPWSELVTRGCGWWVPTDPASLHQALTAALSLTAAERRAMGERGRHWVRVAFDWDRVAEKVAGFYEWVLHGGHRPDFVDI